MKQVHKRPDTGGEPAWLRARRDAAWDAFETAWPPSRKDPRWRDFDPRPIIEQPTAKPGDADVASLAVEGLAHRVVLVDGLYCEDLSAAPEGIRVLPLATDDEVCEVHLGAAPAEGEEDAATHLNMAMWQGGVLIDVQPGANAAIHLLHVRTTPGVTFDRVLVHVQDRGELTIFQEFHGTGASNAVTELHAHTGARIRRDLLQDNDVLHTTFSKADRGATISDVQVHLASGRNTSIARLAGQGAHVDLAGLYVRAGGRSDHFTRVDHAVPHTTSRELYKGVLAGDARTSFTGNVLVRHGAQQTNAEQENRNLLLSRQALAESTPQLEIHADDVQCSHGSTVGQLDEKALFFLRSRGIGLDKARAMLTQAFAGEVVEMLHVPAVRAAVTARIEAWFHDQEVA